MKTETTLRSNEGYEEEVFGENEYIVFCLEAQRYAVRLLDVSEVVEDLNVQAVPNTIRSFLGVANLRGKIIGVIDLKKHFEIPPNPSPQPVLIVFDTDSGPLGALVDQIFSVSKIAETKIDRKASIVSSIPAKYLLGIAQFEERLITLIDLKKILSQQELLEIENIKSKLAEST
jgi:purine-binding chemotaxis protein CheW